MTDVIVVSDDVITIVTVADIISSGGGGGSGTVTSIGMSVPASEFSVSPPTITTSGTFTISKVAQAQGSFWAGSASGGSAQPTFRPITYLDLPIIQGANITLTPSGRNYIISAINSGGTVTQVDSGNLNAFAAVNVATNTTTPAFTFTLTQPGAGQFFGAPASGSGLPTYRNFILSDLPAGTYTSSSSDILNNLASGSGTGFLAQAGSIVNWRTLQGTTNRITISNANGSGDPVFDIGSDVYTKAYSNVLNNLASGVPVAGQVLIGKSDGTFALATVAAGPGVQVNTGSGFLNIGASGYTAGTGISISPANVITNSSPGLTYTAGPGISIVGTLVSSYASAAVIATSNLSPLFTSAITNGTLGFTLSSQASGVGFFGPASGVNAPPTFRALVLTDIPQGVYTSNYSTTLNNFASGTGTGILVQNSNAFLYRTLTGTTNRVTVSNGTGVLGDPTFDVGSDVYTKSYSNTLNSLASGVPVAGQILIGNANGTYTLGTLAASTGIAITTSQGLITITATGTSGGSGTVTTVSDLAPLFTTATRTTTPTFSLSNVASGGLVFAGPASGGTPFYQVLTPSFISNNKITMGILIDNGASAITPQDEGQFPVDFNATITGWTLLSATGSGSVVFNIYKSSYSSFPSMSSVIGGGTKPTITANYKGQNLAINDWSTTSISAGDILKFTIESISGFSQLSIALTAIRTS